MAVLAVSPVLGTVAAVVVYAAGFVLLGRASRRLRPTVRSLTVTTFHGNGRPEVHGNVARLRCALEALTVSERVLRTGGIRPVDFEAVWAEVWEELPERRVRRGGTLRSHPR